MEPKEAQEEVAVEEKKQEEEEVAAAPVLGKRQPKKVRKFIDIVGTPDKKKKPTTAAPAKKAKAAAPAAAKKKGKNSQQKSYVEMVQDAVKELKRGGVSVIVGRVKEMVESSAAAATTQPSTAVLRSRVMLAIRKAVADNLIHPEAHHRATYRFGPAPGAATTASKKKKTAAKSKEIVGKKVKEVKKELSPYMKFAMEQRPELMKRTPKPSVPEMGKLLGAMWNALTTAQKDAYKSKQQQQQQQPMNKKKKVTKKKEDEDEESEEEEVEEKEKKPRTWSGYMVFVNEKRDGLLKKAAPGTRVTEVAKTLGAMWQTLTQAEKDVYNKQGQLHVIAPKKKKEEKEKKEAKQPKKKQQPQPPAKKRVKKQKKQQEDDDEEEEEETKEQQQQAEKEVKEVVVEKPETNTTVGVAFNTTDLPEVREDVKTVIKNLLQDDNNTVAIVANRGAGTSSDNAYKLETTDFTTEQAALMKVIDESYGEGSDWLGYYKMVLQSAVDLPWATCRKRYLILVGSHGIEVLTDRSLQTLVDRLETLGVKVFGFHHTQLDLLQAILMDLH